jgi:hypothetical protein
MTAKVAEAVRVAHRNKGRPRETKEIMLPARVRIAVEQMPVAQVKGAVKAQRLRATLRRAVRVVKAREDNRPARGTTREETGPAARVAGRVAARVAVTNRRAPERSWPRPQTAARRRAKKAPLYQDQDQNQMDKRGLNPAAPINKAEGRSAKVVKALKAPKAAKKARVTKKARAPIR